MNTENNILMAKFAGFTDEKNLGWYDNDNILPEFTYHDEDGNMYDTENLNFHLSWDWLIPVIELCKERQLFGSQHLIDNIDNALLSLEINHLYDEAIVFIKWYNEYNKNN